MKLKTLIISTIAAALGISGMAFAANDYFPPERLHCSVDNVGKLTCSDFNRKYLVEDTYTADFPQGKQVLFMFSDGVAYFTNQDEWQIFYTYKDTSGKNVKLKTTSYSIKPDIQNGKWIKFKEEYYSCNASYMSCPIISLS